MLFYMYAIKRFGRQLYREPHTVMGASLLMTLLSLPVLTLGLALTAGVKYMHDKERGIGVTWRSALRDVRPCVGKALAMGFADLCCLVAAVSSIARLVAGGSFLGPFLSTVFLYLALLYLASGIYRYPILALNPALSLPQLVLCAFSATIKNAGYVFLYWCVLLLALMISAATGVGLVLLLPGVSALLMATAWSETLKRDEYKRTGAAQSGV